MFNRIEPPPYSPSIATGEPELFDGASTRQTPARHAAAPCSSAREAGADSLAYLMTLTERALTGRSYDQGDVIARFLAGLYNSVDFPFPLSNIRNLEADLFEHCLAVLRLFHEDQQIASFLPDGDGLFLDMLTTWGLIPAQPSRLAPEPPIAAPEALCPAGLEVIYEAVYQGCRMTRTSSRDFALLASIEHDGQAPGVFGLRFPMEHFVNIREDIKMALDGARRDGFHFGTERNPS